MTTAAKRVGSQDHHDHHHHVRRRFILGIGFTAAIPWPARAQTTPIARGEAFPWPTLTLLDGRRLEPADWVDTAAVIVVFATWCPYCRRHNAHLEKLHRDLTNRDGPGSRLRVLGAALDGDEALVRRYVRNEGLSFPVTMQGPALHRLASARRVIPLTLTINRAGTTGLAIPGELSEGDVMAFAALAQPLSTTPR
jgi:thiol-disulfide isomerase/thioredoxin